MTLLLNGSGEVGTDISSPGAEGLLGSAGDALWRQLSDLRNEVVAFTDYNTSGRGIPLEGLWADLYQHDSRIGTQGLPEG